MLRYSRWVFRTESTNQTSSGRNKLASVRNRKKGWWASGEQMSRVCVYKHHRYIIFEGSQLVPGGRAGVRVLGNELERPDSIQIVEADNSLANEEPEVRKGDCMIRDLCCFVLKEDNSTGGWQAS